jgi:hypothetical protein
MIQHPQYPLGDHVVLDLGRAAIDRHCLSEEPCPHILDRLLLEPLAFPAEPGQPETRRSVSMKARKSISCRTILLRRSASAIRPCSSTPTYFFAICPSGAPENIRPAVDPPPERLERSC